MDYIDFRPAFFPIVDGVSYCYSVGAYRGKKRVVIAWFAEEGPASDYLSRCRLDHPGIKFDYLRSIF